MNKLKAFVALDSDSNKKNLTIVRKLKNHVYGFKIGYRSFYRTDSIDLIREIKKTSKLFLDLKLNDIPNTVLQGIESLEKINPESGWDSNFLRWQEIFFSCQISS